MEGSSSDGRYGAARCALEAELVQMQGMARQLEAQMGLQGGGGAAMAGAEERRRALVSSMLSSIDRSISIARTRVPCCVEGRLAQPAGAAPESPPSADGSAGSDHGVDSRKMLPKWSTQVRVCSVQDVGPLDDGFSWRKYGQKDILGAKYPRAYFRCTHRHTQGCHASKQVQRADGDPLLFDVVYHGNHTCAQGARSVVDGNPRPRHTVSPEQQPQPPPPQPQQEQNAFSVGINPAKEEGPVQQSLQEPTSSRPFTFTADDSGGTGTLLHGCSTSDCQVSSSVYELGGGSTMAGVRNVPDVELPSKTINSSMGEDMEFMLALEMDSDFFHKYPGYF
uniref:WRKY domain-containing protein n=1 Tax=Oryza brachyantha TaxID=4533 RepID=J3KUW5_ORYBR